MKIGIIGSGNIGATLAHLFVKAGHRVEISNSRGTVFLKALVKSIGSNNITAATPEEAVRFGQVVLLAIPWRKKHELPPSDLFKGKIVIDAMNPYSKNFEVIDLGNSTSSEEVLKQLPDARLVKAFNTMYYEMLRTGGSNSEDGRLVLFVAGDDPDAKAVVSKLIEEIGFTPVDTGSLREGGRKQQPGSPIYNEPMTVEVAYKRLAELDKHDDTWLHRD
ncbi:MAG TPA: NADPH-dependent F420 reductase [Candidatus Nitrosopolaris sp.]|nr:NADPH-dependent F420 reductase [Candidatus Nitrosopolaris sp.]